MANTYSQIYVKIVFAVQGRQNLILEAHKEEIHEYITGIVQNQKQKLIAINVMPDHLHVLVGLTPNVALSDLVRDIKSDSSTFINKRKWFGGKFNWQEGFGAFSYGHSQLGRVVKYIRDQEKHHQHRNFMEEYLSLLRKFQIEFREEYLFEWVT